MHLPPRPWKRVHSWPQGGASVFFFVEKFFFCFFLINMTFETGCEISIRTKQSYFISTLFIQRMLHTQLSPGTLQKPKDAKNKLYVTTHKTMESA